MKLLKLLFCALLAFQIIMFTISCGDGVKPVDSSIVVCTQDVKIDKQTIEEIFLNAISNKTNGNSQVIIKKGGTQVYPPVERKIPKEVVKLLDKKVSFTIPAGSKFTDLVKILNEQFAVKGKVDGNDYVIDL